MKLASYRDGSRDGHLVVVSRDLSTAHHATGVATRLQQVLDDWNFLSPQLEDLYQTLNHGKARHAFAFDPRQCLAPLPRAGQWAMAVADADAEQGFVLTREASNDFAGPLDAIGCLEGPPELELRLAALMDDVARGAHGGEALEGVRLLMLTLTAAFGGQRPFTACSAVAVTPDELAPAWTQGRVAQPARRRLNGRAAGELAGAEGRRGTLGAVLGRLCADRALRSGSVAAAAPWTTAQALDLSLGDSVAHELIGIDGLSVFGTLEQHLTPRD